MLFSSTQPRDRSGFSLIELLVTIAIISTLIAVLLPALGAARETARAAACLANLRNIGQGVQMYTQDHRGHFPLSRHTTGNQFHHGNWVITLKRYGVPQAVRRCPSDPADRNTSYATNDYLEPEGGYIRIDMIPRPTATGFAVESQPNYGTDHIHAHMDGWTQPQQMLNSIDTTRHHGASNVLYVDGHASSLAWKTIQETFSENNNFLNPAAAR